MKLRLILPALLPLGLLAGCAPDNTALEFQVAARTMAHNLMSQFSLRSLAPLQQIGTAIGGKAARDTNSFVIDPFIDGDSGNVIAASDTLAQIAGSEVIAANINYRVVPLSSGNLRGSRYVVTGTVRYEPYLTTAERKYRIYGTVVDAQSGDILAHADAWVANARIADAPTDFYRRSPMYLKDAQYVQKVEVALAAAGTDHGRGYQRTLDAASINADGQTALAQGRYDVAIQDFNASLGAPDGRLMSNYDGLYQAYFATGKKADAEQAFYQMFALGVENNKVEMKILFVTGRTDFNPRGAEPGEYDLWLRQIGRYMAGSATCMDVVGHASAPGDREFNKKLSLDRAQHIRSLLGSAAAPRLSAVGRGSEDAKFRDVKEDTNQNAIDRSVEFRPHACGLA